MSEVGQKRQNWTILAMSAVPPIATELQTSPEVRFGPQAEALIRQLDWAIA
jgi:hypothetical protein